MHDFNIINTIFYVHHLGYGVISGRAETSFSGYKYSCCQLYLIRILKSLLIQYQQTLIFKIDLLRNLEFSGELVH
jgi:hypothetical protein